MIRKIPVIK